MLGEVTIAMQIADKLQIVISSGDPKPVLNFHTLPSTQLSPKMSWILIFNGNTQHPPSPHQCIHWLIITAEGEASRQSFGLAAPACEGWPLHLLFLKRPNSPKNVYCVVSGDTEAPQTHRPVAKQTTKHIIVIRASWMPPVCSPIWPFKQEQLSCLTFLI